MIDLTALKFRASVYPKTQGWQCKLSCEVRRYLHDIKLTDFYPASHCHKIHKEKIDDSVEKWPSTSPKRKSEDTKPIKVWSISVITKGIKNKITVGHH